MPDENTSLIHWVVKLVLLELASTPEADHVVSTEDSIVFDFLVSGFIGPCKWHFRRDIVSSSHVDIIAVEVEGKRSAIVSLAVLLDNTNGSNACGDGWVKGLKGI